MRLSVDHLDPKFLGELKSLRVQNEPPARVIEDKCHVLHWLIFTEVYQVNFRIVRTAEHECLTEVWTALFHVFEQRELDLGLLLL